MDKSYQHGVGGGGGGGGLEAENSTPLRVCKNVQLKAKLIDGICSNASAPAYDEGMVIMIIDE
jgi:hypothetical protein